MVARQVIAALLPLLSITHVLAGPVLTGSCAPLAGVVKAINAYPSATPFCSSWLGITAKTSTSTVTSDRCTTITVTSTTATSTCTAAALTSKAQGVAAVAGTHTTTIVASRVITLTTDAVVVTAKPSTITITAPAVDKTGTLTVTITDKPSTVTAATRVIIADASTVINTDAALTDDSHTTTIIGDPITYTAGTQTVTAATSSITLTANAASVINGQLTLTAETITITEPTQVVTAEAKTRTLTAADASVTEGTVTITAAPVTTTLETLVLTGDTSTLSLTADPASLTASAIVNTADTSTLTLTTDPTTVTAQTSIFTADAVTITSTVKTTGAGFAKRQNRAYAAPANTAVLPPALKALSTIAPSAISSGCACFKIPTPTIVHTLTTGTGKTIIKTVKVAAQTTITPTVIVSGKTTITPQATQDETRSVVITPLSTIVPTTTVFTTPTIIVTPTSTFTPVVYETPLSTSIPITTVHTIPTVFVTATKTSTPSVALTLTATSIPVATEYTTPTVYITLTTTYTPSLFVTPFSTLIPEATAYTTSTIFVTPLSTYTPVVSVTPRSTVIPQATVYTTPTVYITPSSTYTPLATAFVTPATTVTPVSTTTPTIIVTSTQTVQASSLPNANCASDGTSYTARDGAQFLFTCRTDMIGDKLAGVPIAAADNFETCIDRCVQEGTRCAAARWVPDTKLCELKTGAWTNRNAGSNTVYIAIRQTASQGTGTSQKLDNGDFSSGLASWTPWLDNPQCGNFPWSVVNGMASISLSPCGATYYNNLQSSYTIPVGASWTLSLDMYATSEGSGDGRDDCTARFFGTGVADVDVDLPALDSGKKTYIASGTMGSKFDVQPFSIGILCGRGSRRVRISFDNVKLAVVAPEVGANPTVLSSIQVLKNGDFSGTSLDPWYSNPEPPQSFALVDGAGVLTMAPFTNFIYYYYGQTMTMYQDVPAMDIGQTYHMTAKVAFSFPGGTSGSRCSAQLLLGSDYVWNSPSAEDAATYTVDVTATLRSTARTLEATVRCGAYFGSPATPQIAWDDMTLTVNV